MKISFHSFSLRFFAFAALALTATADRAHADTVSGLIGGGVVGLLASPHLLSYMPGNMVSYGAPAGAYTQTPPMVYNPPVPVTVVYRQPAVVYSSVYPTPPQMVYPAGPAAMPYVLVR